MHPAFSVIFFTVSSGAGYGLLGLLGALDAFGLLPQDKWFGFTGITLAMTAVTMGLLSSTFHLGHPERAWRAFSQWRSSWLSREGVVAVLSYGPACLLAAAWLWPQWFGQWATLAGLGCAIMAIATVYCTAMIYRSLKPIPEWHNIWTVPAYLILSAASGAVFLNTLMILFGHQNAELLLTTVFLLAVGWAVKRAYWHHIDTADKVSDIGTATGLGQFGQVRTFEAPHTEDNYLLKEMGYRVARKHAQKLRLYAQILGFAVPAILLIIPVYLSGIAAMVAGLIAIMSVTIGLLVERWLVFAQARHVVALYYSHQTG